ncbi:MAG: sigma 54-interacting transcriptional regulator [Bacteriovoracaceae bacterium]
MEKKLAASDKTLLITGPSGAGKSRKARLCHELSMRRQNSFLHVNLCNFSKGVFESELFGHSKGAFTGAHADRPGFLKAAGKGTLFLDEIGDLAAETQSKLLMLLEEGLFYPVGSVAPQRFKGRLIFATNKNLPEMVSKGEFREDLYHRLRSFEIKMEPLAHRADFLQVAEDLFVAAKCDAGKACLILDEDVIAFLKTYSWPGNFRELKNLMEYFVLMADSVARWEHMPDYIKNGDLPDQKVPDDYHQALQTFERKFLQRMLRKRGFRINLTAREINISKVTLLSKIKKYDIKRETKNDVAQRTAQRVVS